MISAYNSIINYSGDDWDSFLDKISLLDVFNKLIKEYTDKIKLKSAIRYILYTYSIESDKIILGLDWQKNKQKIFEDTCMPLRCLYEDLVLFKNESVVEVINKWITHQDSEIFGELCMLKDLKMELQISANSIIRKSSGEIDYTQKYLNSSYVSELRHKIKDLESEYIQNNAKLKEAVKEVRMNVKSKSTLGVEKFAL